MDARATVVLDIGKTLSKIGLWSSTGELLDRRTRPNARIQSQLDGYLALDAVGIETWLADTLSTFARVAAIGAIIPVGHGAAATIVRDGRLAQPPLDYENPIPSALRHRYDLERGPFAMTGSPALPDGLNLGAQLYFLETKNDRLLAGDAIILPWAQYWSWLLSGVASAEVTSLGCHTDLWHPIVGAPSTLSIARGWADHLAPLRTADAVLGSITPQWAQRTGLPRDVKIHCGLHDSNAALLAARAFSEIAGQDATVLSTGTWFVALRTPAPGAAFDITTLAESRDCLVNVDAFGAPVPSSRFMGGREIEIATALDARIDVLSDQPALLAAVPDVLAKNAMILPTFVPGSGPFAQRSGRWVSMPAEESQRRTAVCLYAALMSDVSLDLIGARDRVLIEGRFAESETFVRALATLRPETAVYVAHAHGDVAYGALRLLNPDLAPPSLLHRVTPLPHNLHNYRERWRREAASDIVPF